MYFVVYLNVNINRGLFMNETVNLTVYQFGPISEADVVFDKYTVLIGKQGSGKSTIAKLYSMFTWLEKGLARRITSENTLPNIHDSRKYIVPITVWNHILREKRLSVFMDYIITSSMKMKSFMSKPKDFRSLIR